MYSFAECMGLAPESLNYIGPIRMVYTMTMYKTKALPPAVITVPYRVSINIHSLTQVLPIHRLHFTVTVVNPSQSLQFLFSTLNSLFLQRFLERKEDILSDLTQSEGQSMQRCLYILSELCIKKREKFW